YDVKVKAADFADNSVEKKAHYEGTFEKVAKFLASMLQWLADTIAAVVQAILDALAFLVDLILAAITAMINTVLEPVVDSFNDWLDGIKDTFIKFGDEVWENSHSEGDVSETTKDNFFHSITEGTFMIILDVIYIVIVAAITIFEVIASIVSGGAFAVISGLIVPPIITALSSFSSDSLSDSEEECGEDFSGGFIPYVNGIVITAYMNSDTYEEMDIAARGLVLSIMNILSTYFAKKFADNLIVKYFEEQGGGGDATLKKRVSWAYTWDAFNWAIASFAFALIYAAVAPLWHGGGDFAISFIGWLCGFVSLIYGGMAILNDRNLVSYLGIGVGVFIFLLQTVLMIASFT
ncbi:MAG: hypothetical protein JSW00_06860, partial [Thermoplasmata archaeon]